MTPDEIKTNQTALNIYLENLQLPNSFLTVEQIEGFGYYAVRLPINQEQAVELFEHAVNEFFQEVKDGTLAEKIQTAFKHNAKLLLSIDTEEVDLNKLNDQALLEVIKHTVYEQEVLHEIASKHAYISPDETMNYIVDNSEELFNHNVKMLDDLEDAINDEADDIIEKYRQSAPLPKTVSIKEGYRLAKHLEHVWLGVEFELEKQQIKREHLAMQYDGKSAPKFVDDIFMCSLAPMLSGKKFLEFQNKANEYLNDLIKNGENVEQSQGLINLFEEHAKQLDQLGSLDEVVQCPSSIIHNEYVHEILRS